LLCNIIIINIFTYTGIFSTNIVYLLILLVLLLVIHLVLVLLFGLENYFDYLSTKSKTKSNCKSKSTSNSNTNSNTNTYNVIVILIVIVSNTNSNTNTNTKSNRIVILIQGCSGKNILGHTLRGVQGAAQAPSGVRGSAPTAEALRALLMQIYAI